MQTNNPTNANLFISNPSAVFDGIDNKDNKNMNNNLQDIQDIIKRNVIKVKEPSNPKIKNLIDKVSKLVAEVFIIKNIMEYRKDILLKD